MRIVLATGLLAISISVLAQDKRDLYGDPLSAGADVRLGTTRFRHVAGAGHDMQNGRPEIMFSDSTLLSVLDDTLRYWDIETGELIREQTLGEERIDKVKLFPVHNWLATTAVSSPPGTHYLSTRYRTRLWDLATGRQISRFAEDSGSWNSVITPEGQTLIRNGGHRITFSDISSGESLLEYSLEPESPLFLDVSPKDDQQLVFATWNGVYVWDWMAGAKPRLLAPLQKQFGTLSISPSQPLLAVVREFGENTVQLWDIEHMHRVRQFVSPSESEWGISHLTFTPDGNTLIAKQRLGRLDEGSGVTQIILWDVATGDIKQTLFDTSYNSGQIVVSPDGRHLALDDGGCLKVWELQTGKQLANNLISHSGHLCQVTFSPDSRFVVTGGGDGTARVWDAATGTQIHELPHTPTRWVNAAVVSPDNSRIATLASDRILHIWDAQTGKEIHRQRVHKRHGYRAILAFTSDGRQLASYGDDRRLCLWDVETGKQLSERVLQPTRANPESAVDINSHSSGDKTVKIPKDKIHEGQFSANAERLVIECTGILCVFDVQTAEQIQGVRHDRYAWFHAVSPDGTLLLTIDSRSIEGASNNPNFFSRFENVVNLYDLNSGKKIWQTTLPGGYEGPVAFSPDGRRMAVSRRYPHNDIHIWDVATKRKLLVIEDAPDITYCNTLAFSPDGKKLASGQADHTVLIWDLLEEGLPESSTGSPEQQDKGRGSPRE